MFTTLLSIALLAASTIQGVSSFTIDTPAFTQCKSAEITWSPSGTAGSPPYNLIIVNSTDPCGDSVADLGDHNGTSMTWTVALVAGIEVQLSLEDADGNEAWSGSMTVAHSDDTSCLSAAQLAEIPSSASSSAPQASGTTLVVTPTTTVQVHATSSAAEPAASAIGGVGNAGANPLGLDNGASIRQASTPVMVLSAIAAVLAISL